jgi:hypothetical protein
LVSREGPLQKCLAMAGGRKASAGPYNQTGVVDTAVDALR